MATKKRKLTMRQDCTKTKLFPQPKIQRNVKKEKAKTTKTTKARNRNQLNTQVPFCHPSS